MTLPQITELYEYWARQPPTHELVAAALGWEVPRSVEEQWADGTAMTPDRFAEAVGAKKAGASHGQR